MTIEQQAQEPIDALPDDAKWRDLLYAFELGGDVEAALADAKAGRVSDTEDLRREYGLHLARVPWTARARTPHAR